jgi:PhoH-like ATPase
MPLPKPPTRKAARVEPEAFELEAQPLAAPIAKQRQQVASLFASSPAASALSASSPVAAVSPAATMASPVASAPVTRTRAAAVATAAAAKANPDGKPEVLVQVETRRPPAAAPTRQPEPAAKARRDKRAASTNGMKKLFVLDTNVLMHDPTCLFRFEEHDVYLPMITLEELDGHKRGMTEVARNVRQVSRDLDALAADGFTHPEDGIPLARTGHREAGGTLYFQTKFLDVTLPAGLPQGKADNQILGVVQGLRQQFAQREIVLVSKDINMRIKARALALTAEDYFNDRTLDDGDLMYTGVLALPDDFWDQHGKTMESWQQGGQTYYRVSGPMVPQLMINQFVYFEAPGATPLYARVTEITGKSAVLKTLKDYTHQKNAIWGITAKNREQNFALNLLMDPDCDFVTLAGSAGTGKTLLTLAAGLAQVMDDRRYSEIIVTRVTVPVGEDIGFLPGTEEEKMGPWMGALDDNLEVLARGDSSAGEWGRAATNDLVRSKIKIKSLNFMRGRTFLNKFVLIDEAQNLTPKQMKTLITRAGPGTKIICLGNLAQIDTPYLTEGSSGLTFAVDRFKGWPHGGHITLARGERSRLADFASDVL